MSQSEGTQTPNTAMGVLVEVAESLKSSAPVVRSRLVSALTERELSKRVDMLDKALVKLKELKKEADKIRPETFVDLAGNKVEGNFTKANWETKKKAMEKLTKLEKAVEKAFAGEEFDKLANLVAGKESGPEGSSEE